DHAWFLFQFVHVALNAIYICSVLGLPTLHAVYSNAATGDLALLCVFSFLWGSGTLFYVLGIDLLGAGLGVS
ncbi:unnamed protein product, partial [Phaeothamnion confervicola]